MNAMNRLIVALLALALVACGDADGQPRTSVDDPEGGFTAFQLEHGVGPFTDEVTLGPIDESMADAGRRTFEFNCEACHRMEERFVGPPLGQVLDRRSPTFVMNFIMNPEQMAREHPEGQAMLAEYPMIMPYQNISEEQAREILEYLRTVQR